MGSHSATGNGCCCHHPRSVPASSLGREEHHVDDPAIARDLTHISRRFE